MDLPIPAQVDIWRQKVLQGTATDEELKQAIEVLRAGRVAAATPAKKASTAAPARSASDILDKLF